MTIYEALSRKLGRKPTNAELKDEVQRIKQEGYALAATSQMTPALENIIFETQKHFIVRASKGFEVYEIGPTAATRCAVIGYEGDKGLERAKLEILRREE